MRSVQLELFMADKKIEYDALISGEGANAIHCRSFRLSGETAVEKYGKPKGTRDYGGITITKAVDKASPHLVEMFARGMGLRAVFRISEPNTASDCVDTSIAQTVTIGGGVSGNQHDAWIRSYEMVVPDVETRASDDPEEPYEKVVFSFSFIRFESTTQGNNRQPEPMQTDDDLKCMAGK